MEKGWLTDKEVDKMIQNNKKKNQRNREDRDKLRGLNDERIKGYKSVRYIFNSRTDLKIFHTAISMNVIEQLKQTQEPTVIVMGLFERSKDNVNGDRLVKYMILDKDTFLSHVDINSAGEGAATAPQHNNSQNAQQIPWKNVGITGKNRNRIKFTIPCKSEYGWIDC